MTNQVVTASTPIIFTDENRRSAVAAVVGLQMKYEKFYELFMNNTKICEHKSNNDLLRDRCNLTCDSQVSNQNINQ